MPLREPTLQEVYNQLNTGLNWGSPIITFSFPLSSIGLYINGDEGPGFTAMLSSGQASARLALSLWDDLILSDFTEIQPGASYDSSSLEFGMTTTGIGYAHAYFPTVGSVWFNPIYDLSSGANNLVTPVIGQHGFISFIHEIGHALGLDHSGIYNGSGTWTPLNLHDSTVFSVMSYFGPDWDDGQGLVAWADWVGADGITYSPQTPMLDDIYVIQRIYGAETTTRLGNTIYGFNSNIVGNSGQIYDFSRNDQPILTIYDSAGIDTLDLSGWSTSSTIDITQGHFSSCNNMTNNIAIAYNCNVENAFGGSGSDKIYGNTLANILNGGAGNDQLFGLGGNDTLFGGAGDDLLYAEASNSIIYGGLGSDTAVFSLFYASYQVTSFQSYLTIQTTGGIIVLFETEYLQFSDSIVLVSSLAQNTDTTAPIVFTFLPLDGAKGVAAASNIVLTFSETIVRGTGSIQIRSGSATGTVIETFDAATSTRLALSGSTLTIDPTNNLADSVQYYVTFTSGTLKDLSGNSYAGISDFNFTTEAPDITAPTVTTFSPFDGATGVEIGGTITLLFSEEIARGEGTIMLRSGSADGTIVESFDVAISSRLIVAGSTITIDPISNLLAGTQYFITISSGSINDLAGNAYTGTTTYDFTTAVTVVSDDYTNATDTTGVVTVGGEASRGVIETAGDLDMLKVTLTAGSTYTFALNTTSGSLDPYLHLYNLGFEQVAFNDDYGSSRNSQITFTATTTGTYYLQASDFYGAGTGSYSLQALEPDTTAPTVSSYSPSDGSAGVEIGSNITLLFSEDIARGGGTITLRSGSAGGAIVESFDAATSSRLVVTGPTLTIDPTNTLLAGTQYFVTVSSGSINDLAGNAYTGTTTYDFTTAAATVSDDYTNATDTTGVVTVGGEASKGIIETAGDLDMLKVTLTAGSTYTFALDANAGSLDPYLHLYNASLVQVAFNDDYGGSRNSQITFTATTTGTYYLQASDYYGSGTGSYSLTGWLGVAVLDDYPNTTETTGIVWVGNSPATGVIETVNDIDALRITLIAGATYTFALNATSGTLDPYLSLYDENSSEIAFNDDYGSTRNAQITFTATATGNYYLAASDYASGIGAYSLLASVADDYSNATDTTGVVTVGTSVSRGIIETSGDQDLFKVTLTAGSTYTFALGAISGALDPYLWLFNANLEQLAFNDDYGASRDALITFTATSTGTYYLQARDYYGFGTGSYSLQALVNAVDTTAPMVSSIAYGTNDGNLALGETVTLTVTLSEAVNVTGAPTLALANGGTATYVGGTGTNTLIFSYTPTAGQTAADLATAASNALAGTIKDLAGNAVAVAGFNDVNPTGVLAVDTNAPYPTWPIKIDNEFLVNTQTINNQYGQTVSALSNGNFIIVWSTQDASQDGSGSALKAQLFNPAGIKIGNEFLVNTVHTSNQDYASVTSLSGGAFVVSWFSDDPLLDGNSPQVRAQIFDASGGAVGQEFLVFRGGVETKVSGLPNGGFVVVSAHGANGEIAGQIYSPTGIKLGGQFDVPTFTNGDQFDPAVTDLGNGGFVVSWRTVSYSSILGAQIKAQIFDASGMKVGSEFLVNTLTDGNLYGARVADLGNGNFVIVWASPGYPQKIEAQIFDYTGNKIGGEFQASGTDARDAGSPDVTHLDNGGFIVTWSSANDGNDIRAQAFDPLGNKTGREFLVNSVLDGKQYDPVVSALANNEVIISWWTDNNIQSTTQFDVKAQLFNLANVSAPISYGANDGVLVRGEAVSIRIAFSEAVNVTGTPMLAMANGGTAIYSGGSGTNILTFTYTAAAGQDTADLATASSGALIGTITDLAGNAVIASGFNDVNPTGILAVDVTAPTVTITDNAAGTATGDVTFSLAFAETVTGLAADDFTLTNGAVKSVTGSGSNYSVVVAPTTGLEGNLGLTLKAGAVSDAAGNASLAASAAAQAIDTKAPTTSSIAYGTNDGNLALGETVTLTVTLSEAVNVTGAPTLALANGGTATYVGGTGTNTLTFSYTPAVGQGASDLATASSGALSGTITDLVGNAVTASGFNAINPSGTLAVDAAVPTVTITDATPGTATGNVTYTLKFSETVTGLTTSDFSLTNGTIASLSGAGTRYTLVASPAAGTQGNMAIALNAVAVTDAAGNPNAQFSASDQAIDTLTPTVTTFSPTDGLTGVALASNIVLTFSETIARGTGSIQIRSGSATGTVVETFNAATSTRLTVSGATLTIDPTNNLTGNTQYFVTFAAGNLKDVAGNAYVGTTAYDFKTLVPDVTAPTVTTFSPTDGLTGVAVGSNIVLTFSETIARGTGSIQIRSGSATGTVVETFDAASSARLTLSGSTLTVDPTNNLAAGTRYYVTFVSGTIKDVAGNSFAGTTSYDFTTVVPDTTAPTVTTFSPTDGLTGVAVGSNIVLTFSETIARGTGSIQIRSGSATGTVVETFDAALSTRLTLSGATLTIDPTNNLSASIQYFVTFASGTIKDTAGNGYAGTTSYDFTTQTNTVTGTANADSLAGTAGIDVVNGLGGNDIITGSGGTDILNGGDGSDIYVMALTAEHTAAEIADTGTSGTDEVRFTSTVASTLTFYAGDTGIETVTIGTGTAAAAVVTGTTALNIDASLVANGLTLTGNSGANTLTGTGYADRISGGAGNDTLNGGAGNDTLIGRAGNDTLTGGNGADRFVLNFAPNATTNKDTITDFTSGTDKIQLSKAVMTALGSTLGTLATGQFWSGAGVTAGHDGDDRIVYNTTTGILYYDADGSGAGAAVQIALLGASTHPSLLYTDLQIIA